MTPTYVIGSPRFYAYTHKYIHTHKSPLDVYPPIVITVMLYNIHCTIALLSTVSWLYSSVTQKHVIDSELPLCSSLASLLSCSTAAAAAAVVAVLRCADTALMAAEATALSLSRPAGLCKHKRYAFSKHNNEHVVGDISNVCIRVGLPLRTAQQGHTLI